MVALRRGRKPYLLRANIWRRHDCSGKRRHLPQRAMHVEDYLGSEEKNFLGCRYGARISGQADQQSDFPSVFKVTFIYRPRLILAMSVFVSHVMISLFVADINRMMPLAL